MEREFDSIQFWNSYEQLISDILTTYTAGIWTICLIAGEFSNIHLNITTRSALPFMSMQMDGNYGKFNSGNSPLLEGIESGCSGFFVLQSAALDFFDVFIDLHDEAGYRSSNKYVLLLVDDDANSNDFLNSVREHPSLPEILNFLVLQSSIETNTVDLLTNRFGGSVEHASELYLVDRYHVEGGLFEFGNWLFPDKTRDLYGKSIRVATFFINPHMLIKEADASNPVIRVGNQHYSMDGFDGLMLVEFCRKRNCTIELVIDEVNMWGKVLPNGTGNGILGDLAERRADIGVGALSSWYNCYRYFTFSTYALSGKVICLVPKPHPILRWKIITMAFPLSAYLAICCAFCSAVVFYMLISHFMMREMEQRGFVWNLFNVLAIFLQQVAKVRNRSASETILSISLLLYVINMGGIFSGRYASLLTIPMYDPAINTVSDLAQSGIHWLQSHEAWSFSLLLSDNPIMMKLVSTFQVYPPSELHRIADEGTAAFVLAQLHIGQLMLGEWITANNIHQYRLMKEELYHEHEVLMATKTWPLMEQLDDVVRHTDSGLLVNGQRLRIIFQYDDYFLHMVALNAHDREENGPRALSLENYLAGFFILGFGLLSAGIVFMLEIIFLKRARRLL